MSETRTGRRFPLQLPIRVAGKDGVTKNVSAAGIFVNADPDVEVGSEVEFDLVLPAEIVGGAADVHVQCTGRVVRVEGVPQGENGGVACIIDHYKMVRSDRPGKKPC
jgi:PilZ domain